MIRGIYIHADRCLCRWCVDGRHQPTTRYLTHVVYVATCDVVGLDTAIAKVGREASHDDIARGHRLVVISGGRVVPLSPYEVGELQRRAA